MQKANIYKVPKFFYYLGKWYKEQAQEEEKQEVNLEKTLEIEAKSELEICFKN